MKRKTLEERKKELFYLLQQYREEAKNLSSWRSIEVETGSIRLWDRSKIESGLDYAERWLKVDWSNMEHVRQSQALLEEISHAITLLKEVSLA